MANVKAAPKSPFLTANKTGLIAHRGVPIKGPENTVRAIRYAGMYGFELVELDVQKTADGHYILMHDKTVDRTTDGTGPVSSFTFEEIRQLKVDQAYHGRDPDEVIRVPTFEEACQECSRWGLGINVDCSKMHWGEEEITYVAELLKKYQLWERSFFVNGDAGSRRLMASLYPDVHLTWLSSDPDPTANIEEVTTYENAFVSYSCRHITPELIASYRAANIPIFVYNCNTYHEVYGLFGKGIRFIETDWIMSGGVL
ncbi:MAG: glycerophosphodiester phosphodiesterase family protein [Firmicutes bacterium]|nr:glycerophosphodiester phosphodiesterase family protein [Bacillota bacterium]